ncbi:VMAP-C domain-containing protein [Streptomyces xylophagus]|uniref:VMAP-C domain-containing protein n=1 Tax=Streptomyces xylophagus TaxID=285514 RepID=UPI0005BD2A30|nr:caspase family protein [Streptomyces xylophagus]
MAELNRIHPGDIHAVVVGLENYPKATEMSLRGAAANALRFARWLREGGVPKQNITLLLSSLDESVPSITAEAESADLTWRSVTAAEDIREVFVHELATVSGEMLYVYWGGHGVLGRNGAGPVLFTPDACSVDLRCFGVEELREFLTRDDLSGFTQQVLFVDACAAFEEQYQLTHGTVLVPFPQPSRREVDQFLLYAARDGQEAEQDMAQGTGLFSRAVLDWLEEHAADLRPDLPELELGVRTWFEERYTSTGTLQTPMAYRYRALDGTQEFGATFARVDHAALLDVAGTLRTAFGADEGSCQKYAGRIAKVCGLAPTGGMDPVEWFARALLRTPRTMATFIEALTSDGDIETAHAFIKLTLVHGVPGLLSVHEHADLYHLLACWPRLSPATVNALTGAATSAVGVQVTANGALSPDELMEHVEGLEKFPGGYSPAVKGFKVPAVVEFVQFLAVHTGPEQVPPALRIKLAKWGDRVAERLLVDASELNRVRGKAEAWDTALQASHTSPRIVVEIYPEGTQDSYTCIVWTAPGTGELSRYGHTDNGVPVTSERAMRLIDRAARSLTTDEGTTPVVEIVLQHDDLLNIPVHAWDGAPGEPPPILLGVEQQIALRCAPMASADREERRRDSLRRRWASRSLSQVVYLDESNAVDDRQAYGTLSCDRNASRVVVRSGRRNCAALVRAALFAGYPVVLWDSADSHALATADFAPLQPDGALHELPERVQSYWARAQADGARHPLRPALLLEDHDQQLPPVLSLTRSSIPEEEASR